MARQRELFPSSPISLSNPRGATDPRFYIRRLVIWQDTRKVLQDIKLGPGLNIIWSPDPKDDARKKRQAGPGHGSGKTLFCRLLRYCLGESTFAPEGLHDDISVALKDGLVGAEVVLDGETWAVLRSIGIGSMEVAERGGDLEKIVAEPERSTGLDSFQEAIGKAFLSSASALMPSGFEAHTWPVALAWLTRDQECRFDDVLEWRDRRSGSESPARRLGASQALDALRAFIRAITKDEYALRDELQQHERDKTRAETELEHLNREARQLRSRTVVRLKLAEDGIPPGRLAIAQLKEAAETARGAAAQIDPSLPATLEALRKAWADARDEAGDLARSRSEAERSVPLIEQNIALIRGEMPGLSYGEHEAANPSCPICEVPIDRALAEKCSLSHRLPNLAEVKERRTQRQHDLNRATTSLKEAKEAVSRFTRLLPDAAGKTTRLLAQLQSLERAHDAKQDAWYLARRSVDEVTALDQTYLEIEKQTGALSRKKEAIDAVSEKIGSERAKRARGLARLAELFDQIVKAVVHQEARGTLKLDGNGLHLSVDLGGQRFTPAIELVKVLAFDLASMCLSTEEKADVPAFLLHDSPREADLGLSVYHAIFELVHELEKSAPRFQYIITTTTRPPAELCDPKRWLRLEIAGAPATKRLLKRDLP